MNLITYAINDLAFHFSKEILNIGFKEFQPLTENKLVTIEEIITNNIIRRKVLVDSNVVGGEVIDIFLDKCNVQHIYEQNESIITVPKELTANRSIIEPLSLVLNSYIAGNGMLVGSTSNVLGSMTKLVSAHTGPDVIQTSKMQMIGENKILVQSSTALYTNGILRVNIENSQNLDNMNQKHAIVFSKLVRHAIKMYMYNNTRVQLNQGYIYGGHELSIVSDIVSEFSSAEQDYYETLTKEWAKCSMLNSDKVMTSMIGLMLGSKM
jgi:hypothetical protein